MFDAVLRPVAPGEEREAGFTLIELLIVMVLLAVLITIAFPSYLGYRNRAEQRTAQANLRAAVPAVEAYYADNESYTGMSVAALKLIDGGIASDGTNGLFVVSAADSTYCLRSVRGGATFYKHGPGAAITSTACS
jgi:type IV pilus assembly protein PilA